MRLGSVLLAVGITITVLMFPSSANPAGEANFAQTLIFNSGHFDGSRE